MIDMNDKNSAYASRTLLTTIILIKRQLPVTAVFKVISYQ
jgi:hypothetical protein